jgi:aminomethyltransferase
MTLTTTEASNLPLQEIHSALGATFVNQDNWQLPASYGDEPAEYDAVRKNTGLIDLSARGRFHVRGSEAVMFLNGLISNDMKTLAGNRWMHAFFPTVQGRLIAAVRVIHLPDQTFILDTEAATREGLMNTISRFTLAGDFHVTDMTNHSVLLSLQGPHAPELTHLFGDVADLPPDGVAKIDWDGTSLTILRGTHTAEDGFDLIVPNANASRLWNDLVNAGAMPVGHAALEVLRIEAGIPRYGADMDDSNVVPELNMVEEIMNTTGFNIGQ